MTTYRVLQIVEATTSVTLAMLSNIEWIWIVTCISRLRDSEIRDEYNVWILCYQKQA